MEITPLALYQQTVDNQRILVTGSERARLTGMITSILKFCQHKYNLYSDGEWAKQPDAPIVLINAAISSQSVNYQHHVLLLTTCSENELGTVTDLVNATPKSGMIIYPEADQKLKAIIGKERADVQLLPYKIISHEVKDGQTFLVSSTNEKFRLQLNGTQNLILLAAAKELVRKIGISSGQFYKAAGTLE